ncbi:MAG: glucose-6-phosphate dehydrogenase [Acidobacteriota bacterium]
MANLVNPADPCTVVIFGASGDLTRRLLIPSLYNLAEAGHLSDRFAMIGVGRSGTGEELLQRFREAVEAAEKHPPADDVLQRVTGQFSYVQADFDDPEGWKRLVAAVDASGRAVNSSNCLFYLATAPEQFLNICERLAEHGLLNEQDGAWRRVIVEKPFGVDFGSARELNRRLTAVMKEEQIYRIDHYLGKETVQNILVFRFGNGIFEPIWNRRYVDHVQITVAESLGVEMRGGYYDQTGALRDMVPNHLFQILTLTAMEPPSSLEASGLHHEQVKVLDAIEPLAAKDFGVTTVRAQYESGIVGGSRVAAYRAEPKVNASSLTETYAAFKISVDNWRWAGVPFYLRTGKRLKQKKSEVVIQFRQPPLALFREASMAPPEPNQLVISIQPEETIKLRFAAKVPGPEVSSIPVDMRFNYDDHFGVEHQTGYETLLYDAMTGDRSLYKRADMIESGWAVVDAILTGWMEDGCDLARYPAGSQGPAAADQLMARDGRRWKPL